MDCRGACRRGIGREARRGAVSTPARALARVSRRGLGLHRLPRGQDLGLPFPEASNRGARNRAGNREAALARAAAARGSPKAGPRRPAERRLPVALLRGALYLPGAEPDSSLREEVRGALARPLARALRALHARASLAAV